MNNVAIGLVKDHEAAASKTKTLSNVGVNAGFALGGVLAESGIAYALTAAGVSAGPAGWIALGVVFAVSLTLSLTGVDDVVKNQFNSLEKICHEQERCCDFLWIIYYS